MPRQNFMIAGVAFIAFTGISMSHSASGGLFDWWNSSPAPSQQTPAATATVTPQQATTTTRYYAQTEVPGSAYSTPSIPNSAPPASTVPSLAPAGSTVQGSTVQGSTYQGSTYQGSTYQGSTYQGSPYQGSVAPAATTPTAYQNPCAPPVTYQNPCAAPTYSVQPQAYQVAPPVQAYPAAPVVQAVPVVQAAPVARPPGYMPHTAYRSGWARVPVTSYRPVATPTIDPRYGGQNISLKPCTTYQYQLRRTPVMTLSPVVAAPAVTTPTPAYVAPVTSNYVPQPAPAPAVRYTPVPAGTQPVTQPQTINGAIYNSNAPVGSGVQPATGTTPADSQPTLTPNGTSLSPVQSQMVPVPPVPNSNRTTITPLPNPPGYGNSTTVPRLTSPTINGSPTNNSSTINPTPNNSPAPSTSAPSTSAPSTSAPSTSAPSGKINGASTFGAPISPPPKPQGTTYNQELWKKPVPPQTQMTPIHDPEPESRVRDFRTAPPLLDPNAKTAQTINQRQVHVANFEATSRLNSPQLAPATAPRIQPQKIQPQTTSAGDQLQWESGSW